MKLKKETKRQLALIPGYIILVLFCLFIFIMVGWIILASFSTTSEIFKGEALKFRSGFHFENYVKGLNTLNAYLDGSDIDRQALRIFGGHFWQKDWFPELGDGEFGISYIEDMTALVSQICSGQAAREPSGLDHPVLDTYFRYGSAIVVWNSGIADEMFGAEGEASGATASR